LGIGHWGLDIKMFDFFEKNNLNFMAKIRLKSMLFGSVDLSTDIPFFAYFSYFQDFEKMV